MTENQQEQRNVRPCAAEGAVVRGEKYRFTVLTDRLIRMEYQKDGCFTDEPTQTVICREFPVPDYQVVDGPEHLEIITDQLHLYYDRNAFSAEGLYIFLKERYGISDSVWNFGDEIRDLRGTARTLDNADGPIPLEAGLMSREGYTVWDDSRSALLTEDGWVKARERESADLYFFGYGHDYLGCLRSFYHLSGAVPLLPKYTLGNWWSRFYPYSEESYLALMEKFREHGLPFSVSVIDMDWHLTDVPAKYGSGWTGYTWNTELFPDPKRFLKKLHEMGKRVTLNLHPADGVRAFEEAYLPMAKELGRDYANEEKIPFDVTDRKFMEAYFKYLHHPQEENGVDFWWVDWQQGSQSRTKGVDPLWMLNHLHFLDSGRDGKLPLTFSRYAGLGSHRYPVGFSGDSVTSWESLKFQPYFTANASNAGYTWWSHDIGGHQRGRRDDELAVRWVQYGVFSPIMRLHSTANEFYGKEPWNYNPVAESAMTEFLRLRHRMVPYLHTWNYRTHLQGEPLVQPMYYRNDVPEAYEVPNEYYFGDLIVCPVTEPADQETLLAPVHAWLPEGLFYDFFSGRIYRGGQKITMYRDLSAIPVLAPAGSIIPLAEDYGDSCRRNPKELELMVFHGAEGSFELYEDDCSERSGMEPVVTTFSYRPGDTAEFAMKLADDPAGVVPEDRSYRIRIRGIGGTDSSAVTVCCADSQEEIRLETSYDACGKELSVLVEGKGIRRFTLRIRPQNVFPVAPDQKEAVRELLQKAQLEFETKEKVFRIIRDEPKVARMILQLQEMELKKELLGAVTERLLSDH